jgi:hypothetical protein
MHHLQRKRCTMNSGMDAPSQTATMHYDQRSMRTIRRGVFIQCPPNQKNREISKLFEKKILRPPGFSLDVHNLSHADRRHRERFLYLWHTNNCIGQR